MNKKGQITLFIIIGIVLVIVVGLTLFLVRSNKTGTIEEEVSESATLKGFVENCIEEVAVPALYLQGLQGGYIYPPEDSFQMEEYNYRISYLYSLGKNNVPSRTQMQNDINRYINENLDSCLDNFNVYKEQGYDISLESINTKSTIGLNDVFIKVNYPIILTKGNTREEVNEFSSTIPVRLGHLNDLSKEFIDAVVKNPERVDMTMLGGFDVEVVIIPYSQDTIIYSFYDEKSDVRDERYIFLFATKT